MNNVTRKLYKTYWYITPNLQNTYGDVIFNRQDINSELDDLLWISKNYFNTEEQARVFLCNRDGY